MNTAPEIRASPGTAYPPGPRLLPRLLTGRRFRQDPVEFLVCNARQYGDLVHFRSLEGHIHQFNHPALIQEIMVDHERRNRRALVAQPARPGNAAGSRTAGRGIAASEEPLHMRQRRLAAPAFHRQRIAAYGAVIGQYAAEVIGRWQPGTLDMHPQMLLLALRVVGKCLFDIDDEAEARRIAAAVGAFMVPPPPAYLPAVIIDGLQKLPFGPMLKVRQGIDALDGILYGMIAPRRA